GIGSVNIGYPVVAQILVGSVYSTLDKLPAVALSSPFEVRPEYRTIVMRLRLPRIAVGAVVGFALGSAGAVMQGFFRNPMADPSIIGVSSGAAVGAVATIVLPLSLPFGLISAAFVGAVSTGFLVYLLATKNGRTSVATLLLAGVAVQTFLGAVISFLLYRSDRSLREAIYWLMGNLVGRDWEHVKLTLPVVFLGFIVLMAYSRDLNILLMGEEDAQSLGVEVERTKRVLLAVSSVVTAAAVAVAGVIGFVGLIVPHVMRLIVGPDHRILVPTSAIAGAVFLVAADSIARTALGAAELPVGIVTAFVGVPFFLYLLRQREVYDL
ncbi:MAG: vitamin B12 ABC transporter permease BtuC, partial [Halobacteria archaeon]|nr:vitamin B12 ABC transporter permease BtuC [Halobacteria archaeon]